VSVPTLVPTSRHPSASATADALEVVQIDQTTVKGLEVETPER
jgi:hypothetical protein